MNEIVVIIGIALLAIGAIALGWWLIIETEGVYLGRRVVIWLYDLFANRYDDVKGFDRVYEHALVAQPIMERIAPHKAPLVLDVATGTARLPLALLNHAHFQGRIIGADLSRKMLHAAAPKLDGHTTATLLWTPAEQLPFADNTFDVVTCLEALEFMHDPAITLAEMLRVLRPGGLLFISNRINTRYMPGKTWNRDQIGELLIENGIVDADIAPWQQDYQRVWAIKDGEAQPTGARPLGEVLRCPCCIQPLMQQQDDAWRCPQCGGTANIAQDGVIEIFPLLQHCS